MQYNFNNAILLQLGTKSLFTGDQPTETDCAMFGILSQLGLVHARLTVRIAYFSTNKPLAMEIALWAYLGCVCATTVVMRTR